MDWESIAPFKILLKFSKIPEALNVVLRVSYIFFGFSTSFFEAGFLKHADDYPFSTHESFAEKNNYSYILMRCAHGSMYIKERNILFFRRISGTC